MTAEFWIAGLVGVAATVEDLARRRVSNWTSLAALVGGIGCQIFRHGWIGLPLALAGAVCGFLVFLIFYILGGMGAGDIKLMAGFGALLGYSKSFEAALWTAGIGGVIALGVVAYQTLRALVRRKKSGELKRENDESIPYAPAITLGVWLAMVPR
ncbi:MAG: A24 family peptidase [Bryobacteraceae bacterium]